MCESPGCHLLLVFLVLAILQVFCISVVFICILSLSCWVTFCGYCPFSPSSGKSLLSSCFKKKKTTKKVGPLLSCTCANKCHFGDIFMFWHFFLQILFVFFFPDIPWSIEASTLKSLFVCIHGELRGRHCVCQLCLTLCLSQRLWSVLRWFHEPDLQRVPVSLRVTGLRSSRSSGKHCLVWAISLKFPWNPVLRLLS